MNVDSILGIIIITSGLCFITYITLWSRRAIKRIENETSGSLREILKELYHGR